MSDRDDEIVRQALVILKQKAKRGESLISPNAVKDYLIVKLTPYEHECFTCIFLDNRNRLIEINEMFRGTIDGASVYPREVVKTALAYNSAAVIFCHNHPSGVAEPSKADEMITERLKKALELIDVRVLDHLIIAGGECVSFAERGLL